MKKAIKALGIITLMTIGTTAWGEPVRGAEAEKIIVKGEIVYAGIKKMNVIYKGRIYKCILGDQIKILHLVCTNID